MNKVLHLNQEIQKMENEENLLIGSHLKCLQTFNPSSFLISLFISKREKEHEFSV